MEDLKTTTVNLQISFNLKGAAKGKVTILTSYYVAMGAEKILLLLHLQKLEYCDFQLFF